MPIKLNGQTQILDHPSSLKALIEEFSPNSRHVIAEVNGKIIKSPLWEQTLISDGDSIELVTFVGGG